MRTKNTTPSDDDDDDDHDVHNNNNNNNNNNKQQSKNGGAKLLPHAPPYSNGNFDRNIHRNKHYCINLRDLTRTSVIDPTLTKKQQRRQNVNLLPETQSTIANQRLCDVPRGGHCTYT